MNAVITLPFHYANKIDRYERRNFKTTNQFVPQLLAFHQSEASKSVGL